MVISDLYAEILLRARCWRKTVDQIFRPASRLVTCSRCGQVMVLKDSEFVLGVADTGMLLMVRFECSSCGLKALRGWT